MAIAFRPLGLDAYVYPIESAERPIGWIDYPAHAARLGAESDTGGIDLAIGEPTPMKSRRARRIRGKMGARCG